MRISTVRETTTKEARVGLTPAGVTVLVGDGHDVFVERNAGLGAGFSNDDYEQAGAKLVDQVEAWGNAELLVKVKEPVAAEHRFLREDLTLFAYLHLAVDRPLTHALLNARTLGIAYETVQDHTGLPLLTPMSEIAGRLAAHAAATYLTACEGSPGLLLGGSPGDVPLHALNGHRPTPPPPPPAHRRPRRPTAPGASRTSRDRPSSRCRRTRRTRAR